MVTLKHKVLLLLLVSFLVSEFSFSQQPNTKTDSTNLYKNLETYSNQSKFKKFMYRLVFKPSVVDASPKAKKKKNHKTLIKRPLSRYEGKIIRYIRITTLDPFGYSISDTTAVPQSFLPNAGNMLHVKSLDLTIRNLLLFRQNQVFDSLIIKESERLVRSSGFVRDVSFMVIPISKNADSVDILIRELDKWSIVPIVIASTSSLTFKLSDKNFSGLGHESKNDFTWHRNTGEVAYNINYLVPNVRNTYINSTIHYGITESNGYSRSLAFDRPLFSPFAKWAAGIGFSQEARMDSLKVGDSTGPLQRIICNTQDYYVAKANRIIKGNTLNSRTTNLITAVRFIRIRYLEKPPEFFDPLFRLTNEDFYLAGIGISTRKYVQDKNIFKYGITEDVPTGKVYELTAGYQVKNNIGRLYVRARISSGKYYPWGYLSANVEYGSFFRGSKARQGVFSASAIYYTNIIEVGKWKFRQFLKPQVIIGINRFSYDSLTLNDGHGLDGFNSNTLSGSSRLIFTFQTQSYCPWVFFGFHFGPYLSFSFGMLGQEEGGFRKQKVYSQMGMGVLIKNEHLVISTFQISASFYPLIPGNGQNIYKINSVKSTDFGFRDFVIGKPATVDFQ